MHPRLTTLLCASLLPTSAAWAVQDGLCAAWEPPAMAAGVEDDRVDQVSGIVASHRYPGVLWAQEDAGSDAELIALGEDGAVLNRVDVAGADNTDWEDLTLGPCATDTVDACGCLYLGDFGSNDGTRTEGVVWQVPEPHPLDDETRPARALRFTWPDGPHDAEALFVHPVTGVLTVVTKEASGPARLYRFPGTVLAPSTATVELLAMGTLDLEAAGSAGGRVTGGAVSPLGDRLALRTTADVLLFALGADDVGAAVQGEAEVVAVHPSTSGEAVTFTPDGRTLLLVDEGASPTVWQVSCAEFDVQRTADPDPLGDCLATADGCGCATGPRGAPAALALATLGLIRRRRR